MTRGQLEIDLGRAQDLDEGDDVRASSWECGFLNNILIQLEAGRPLSERQRSTLNEIYERELE